MSSKKRSRSVGSTGEMKIGNAEADSVHWQLNDSIRLAAISTAALATAASACDGDLITRLEWIAHNATSRLTASVSGLVLTVQQCVPAFVFHARQHQEAVDKRLQQAEEEHVDNVKVLRLYQQLLQACDGPVKVSEEVFAGACKLLETVDGFSGVSTVQVPVVDAVTVNPASYVQDSVDFCRSIITHAPWLPRGDRSSLLFNLVDHIGEPVHGITAVDIVCGFSTETAGWSVVSVFVQLNEVSVSVELAADCSNTTTLEANIFGASLQMQLKATASPTAITVAQEECRRVCDIQGPVKCGDVTSLVTACTAALSSSRVAEDFVTVVDRLCGGKPENRVACVGAGVIEAVIAALNAHGRNSARIAAKGCVALNAFSCGNRANSDAIVIAHGLDAICLALVSHCRIEEVQREGCWALWFLACAASAEAVSVMLAGQAVELLRAAKKNFPEGGHGSVKGWADLTLAQLQLEVPDADPLTAGSKRDATRPTT